MMILREREREREREKKNPSCKFISAKRQRGDAASRQKFD